MPHAVSRSRRSDGHELITTLRQAVGAIEALLADATRAVRDRVTVDGRAVARLMSVSNNEKNFSASMRVFLPASYW